MQPDSITEISKWPTWPGIGKLFGKLWAPTPSFYAAINLIIKVCGNMRNVLYELLSGRNPHLSTKLCTCYNFNEGKRWTKVGRRYIKNANNFARVGIFSAFIIALIFLNLGDILPGLQGPHQSLSQTQPLP